MILFENKNDLQAVSGGIINPYGNFVPKEVIIKAARELLDFAKGKPRGACPTIYS